MSFDGKRSETMCFAQGAVRLQRRSQTAVDWNAASKQPRGTFPSAQLPLPGQVHVSSETAGRSVVLSVTSRGSVAV